MNKQKILFLKLGGLLLIIIIVVAFLLILIGIEKEAERDAQRLVAMEKLRSTMEMVKNESGNYIGNDQGCLGPGAVNLSCRVPSIAKYLETIANFKDPVGGQLCELAVCAEQDCEYYFAGYAEDKDDYEVFFHLEKGLADSGPGCYKLTKLGISFVQGPIEK